MNELLDHPAVLIGAAVLIVVALLMGSKHAGPTYAVAAGPTSADLKTVAEAQSTADTTTSAARAGIMDSINAYQGQRQNYQLARAGLATDAAVTRYQTDTAERVTNRQTDAAVSVAHDQNATQLKITKENNNQQTVNGFFGLVGGIFKGLFSFL